MPTGSMLTVPNDAVAASDTRGAYTSPVNEAGSPKRFEKLLDETAELQSPISQQLSENSDESTELLPSDLPIELTGQTLDSLPNHPDASELVGSDQGDYSILDPFFVTNPHGLENADSLSRPVLVEGTDEPDADSENVILIGGERNSSNVVEAADDKSLSQVRSSARVTVSSMISLSTSVSVDRQGSEVDLAPALLGETKPPNQTISDESLHTEIERIVKQTAISEVAKKTVISNETADLNTESISETEGEEFSNAATLDYAAPVNDSQIGQGDSNGNSDIDTNDTSRMFTNDAGQTNHKSLDFGGHQDSHSDAFQLRSLAINDAQAFNLNAPSIESASEIQQAKSVSRQVTDSIVRGAKLTTTDSQVRLEVRIDPPELGPVLVELSESSAGVNARLVFAHQTTMQMVQSQIDSIHAALQGAGVDLLEFNLQHQSNDGSHHSHSTWTDQPLGHDHQHVEHQGDQTPNENQSSDAPSQRVNLVA